MRSELAEETWEESMMRKDIDSLELDKAELLAALIGLMAVECIDDYTPAHEKARAAIAKATGELR